MHHRTMSVMNAVIVYESMFGGTRRIAEAVAMGLSPRYSVSLVGVGEASSTVATDFLIVGAPTHAGGLSSYTTREEAAEWSRDPERHLMLEPEAGGIGVREWLDDLDKISVPFAAFDTRGDAMRLMTGSAATHIDRKLRELGGRSVADPESFRVHENSLIDDELSRAVKWSELLSATADN